MTADRASKLCCAALLWVSLLPGVSGAEGVRGRASLDGAGAEGVDVRAYPYRPGTFGPLTGVPPAAQVRTGKEGTYELAVPPGRYVVEGLKKAPGNPGKRPETGDLHCLSSGAPFTVVAGAWTSVGLSLVKVPAEQRKKAEQSGFRGRLTLNGKDVEKVYLYAYDEVGSAFHGPARILQPVAKGTFKLRAPPGTYYLVARKRVRGGAYGPIEVGDLFNFYPRNPLVLDAGDEVTVEIPLVERLSPHEEDPGAVQGVSVRVVDGGGKDAVGYYVLAYSSEQRTGPPLVTSGRTDAEGKAQISLPPGQTAFLRARKTLGGPLEKGEWFADGVAAPEASARIVLRLKKAP